MLYANASATNVADLVTLRKTVKLNMMIKTFLYIKSVVPALHVACVATLQKTVQTINEGNMQTAARLQTVESNCIFVDSD